MLHIKNILLLTVLVLACSDEIISENKPNGGDDGSNSENQSPPFSGTIFVDSDILTDSDPTTFQNITYASQGVRLMFDRRVNKWINVNAFLFDVTFSDGLATEVQVNPEFKTKDIAEVEANKYAIEIGRLPKILRKDVHTVWIHKGVEPFGGGNNNILIHTGKSAEYENDGILEETLIHEASHTSLDKEHASASGWISSQVKDGNFISTYAKDNSKREDIAESFLVFLAVKYRSDRITTTLKDTINSTIPNRISYFEHQSFDVSPMK